MLLWNGPHPGPRGPRFRVSGAARLRPLSLEDRGPIRFVHLAARCLEECGEWQECLQLLGDGELDAAEPATPRAVSFF